MQIQLEMGIKVYTYLGIIKCAIFYNYGLSDTIYIINDKYMQVIHELLHILSTSYIVENCDNENVDLMLLELRDSLGGEFAL